MYAYADFFDAAVMLVTFKMVIYFLHAFSSDLAVRPTTIFAFKKLYW